MHCCKSNQKNIMFRQEHEKGAPFLTFIYKCNIRLSNYTCRIFLSIYKMLRIWVKSFAPKKIYSL